MQRRIGQSIETMYTRFTGERNIGPHAATISGEKRPEIVQNIIIEKEVNQ